MTNNERPKLRAEQRPRKDSANEAPTPARFGRSMIGIIMMFAVGAGVYFLLDGGSGGMSESEWQEAANEACAAVEWIAGGIIEERNLGVRSGQMLMLQIEAGSLEWPVEARPFLLEMARDIVDVEHFHSDASLVAFARTHCLDVLRERTR